MFKMNTYFQSKLYAIGFCITALLFLSAGWLNGSQAPEGYTGANGVTCNGCHGGNPLNASGGSITINGLPDEYIPGTAYPISITITHASNRSRWGFSVKAIGSNNNTAGNFSSTNPNAGNLGSELGHINAPSQSGTSYTFSNLRWTAPSNPVSTEQNIRFFAAGNASNGFGSSGDFIYTATKTIVQKTSAVENRIPEIEKWYTNSSAGMLHVYLSLRKSSNIQATLFTMDGKEILKSPAHRLSSGSQQLNIATSGILPAAYILTLQNGNRKESKKIMLQ